MIERFAAIDRHIETHLEGWLAELTALCRVPSVSARHEGIEECAILVSDLLASRGFESEVLPSDGHPVVLAHSPGANAGRTMLLYNHYDVQPPEPLDLWESPPFQPEIRDGLIFARGAKDDKGELVARLAALDALLAVDGCLPCKVTWLVEGEEEVGSPNLPAFVERYAERLRCDGAIWEEGGTDAEGRPQVTLGARGMLYLELGVRALSRDGHSGTANLVPNAAWRLVWALGSLKGPDERVRIPGFYEGIRPISDRQRQLLAALPSQEEPIKESFGLDELLLGRTGQEVVAAPFEPTCNIAGLTAGYQGEGAKTVIPAVASAKVDFRLLPGQDPFQVARQLREHLDRQHFGDVGIKILGAERAGVVDPDDPLVSLTVATAEEVYGKPAQLLPMSGGTTPTYLFTEKGVPVVTPGVGFGTSNLAHSPNENMRLVDFKNAARHVARLLAGFAEL
jgi:acetylornithine deacetylase/succinyl-diaminopimelate desuccinylase-like protein